MMKQTLSAIAILAMSLSIGCGKEESKDGKEGEATPAATSDDKAAADKPADKAAGDKPAAGGEEEVICCEFGGATGTSTKAKCAEFKGKVVEGLAPPCK